MQQPNKSKWNFFELSTEQKAVFVILITLGVGGIAIGAKSFGTNIRRPFIEQLQDYAQAGVYLTPEERERKEQEELKQKDTDKDGLNDYDELNVFNTSPYLADTDSDGYDDQTEVFSNNDPNCPEGQDCVAYEAQEEGAAEDQGSADQLLNPGDTGSLLGGAGGGDAQDLQEQLDQLNNLNNTFSGQAQEGASGDQLSGTDLSSQDDLMTFFNSLSADQIRAAMIDAGISESQIEGLSDEEVKQLFQQAIGQAQESGALSSFADQISGSQSDDSQTQQ